MDEGRQADGVYDFGDFRLLAAQRRLTARSDGRLVRYPSIIAGHPRLEEAGPDA